MMVVDVQAGPTWTLGDPEPTDKTIRPLYRNDGGPESVRVAMVEREQAESLINALTGGFEAGKMAQSQTEQENQRRQLAGLHLLGEFVPSCDLADHMGETLCRERGLRVLAQRPIELPTQPVDRDFDTIQTYREAVQSWERVCMAIIRKP